MFYCYLIKSQQTATSKATYIGFSTQPLHRLRQHNGELVSGARRTSKYRPWVHIAIVGGFPNKIVALQFEWQWQHPSKSRILGSDGTKARKTGHKQALAVLGTMLQNKLWQQLNLTVSFATNEHLAEYLSMYKNHTHCVGLVDHAQLAQEAVVSVPVAAPPVNTICIVCNDCIENSTQWFWSCTECHSCCHLLCAAEVGEAPTANATANRMVPEQVTCTACAKQYKWSHIVSKAQRYSIIGGGIGNSVLDSSTIHDTGSDDEDHEKMPGTQDVIEISSCEDEDSGDDGTMR